MPSMIFTRMPPEVKASLGTLGYDRWPYLAQKPADPLLIGQPVHAAQMEEAPFINWFGSHGVVIGIDTEGDRLHRCSSAMGYEVCSVRRADGRHAIHLSEDLHFIPLQLLGEELPVGPLQGVAFPLCDTLLDDVLEVV
jgi:hypothetical protein